MTVWNAESMTSNNGSDPFHNSSCHVHLWPALRVANWDSALMVYWTSCANKAFNHLLCSGLRFTVPTKKKSVPEMCSTVDDILQIQRTFSHLLGTACSSLARETKPLLPTQRTSVLTSSQLSVRCQTHLSRWCISWDSTHNPTNTIAQEADSMSLTQDLNKPYTKWYAFSTNPLDLQSFRTVVAVLNFAVWCFHRRGIEWQHCYSWVRWSPTQTHLCRWPCSHAFPANMPAIGCWLTSTYPVGNWWCVLLTELITFALNNTTIEHKRTRTLCEPMPENWKIKDHRNLSAQIYLRKKNNCHSLKNFGGLLQWHKWKTGIELNKSCFLPLLSLVRSHGCDHAW